MTSRYPESPVAVVADSGCSLRPDSAEVILSGVSILPLEVRFHRPEGWIPYSDNSLSSVDFYRQMASSDRPPQTSGAVTPSAIETYQRLSQKTQNIISLHITGRHSVAFDSASLAARTVTSENPSLSVATIDTRNISLATWFLVDQAASLSRQGYPLSDIQRIITETTPRAHLFTALPDIDNLIKGGRVSTLQGIFGQILHIKPVLTFIDGQITLLARTRTFDQATKVLLDQVDRHALNRIAVVHTNSPERALDLQTRLHIYSDNIPIYEAGPVLAAHAGPGALGIALLTTK